MSLKIGLSKISTGL